MPIIESLWLQEACEARTEGPTGTDGINVTTGNREGPEMKTTVVGVDIAKRVFQLHWVEAETGEIVGVQLKREKFLEHFANRSPCVIGMESCGGSQPWARQLRKLGHEVKLLSGRMVKAL